MGSAQCVLILFLVAYDNKRVFFRSNGAAWKKNHCEAYVGIQQLNSEQN